MLAEIKIIFGLHYIVEFLADKDPLFIVGLGVMGCCFMILSIASIPWQIYKKNEIKLLKEKIDILITEYKMEVTRAIEKKY